MRLAVQLVCLCALAAAVSEQPPQAAPSGHQLQGILRNLYRRFLHTVAPQELEIEDALGIDLLRGKVGQGFISPVSLIKVVTDTVMHYAAGLVTDFCFHLSFHICSWYKNLT